jgi:hypothetical protein
VFHLQLRQFPHNHCQFNLGEEQVRSLAERWVRGEWIVIGERRWNPNQAKLTVIEGPQIPVQQLSMGRGWRQAERTGENVTQRALGAASAASGPPRVAPGGAPASTAFAPESPAGEEPQPAVLALLGEGVRGEVLLAVWRQTAARFPERSPSECLALAEQQLEAAAQEAPRSA